MNSEDNERGNICMKRLILFLLLLALLLLTGCSESTLLDFTSGIKDAANSLLTPEAAVSLLSPVDNTAENLLLMDALGQNRKHDSRIFDFNAPDGAQRMIITQWEWVDGQWTTPGGRMLLLTDEQGRLGLNWDSLCAPVGIVVRSGGQTFAVSRSVAEGERPIGEQTVTIFQSMDTEITMEKDIPLVMQIITNAEEPPVIPLECWQEPERFAGHEGVYLVTVRFSMEPTDSQELQRL